jgi:hypothetical protein
VGDLFKSIMEPNPKKPRKPRKRDNHKQMLNEACQRRGLIGTAQVGSKAFGKEAPEEVKRIHRNIGSFKSIFALGLEEL